jgi:hypothetical protein
MSGNLFEERNQNNYSFNEELCVWDGWNWVISTWTWMR